MPRSRVSLGQIGHNPESVHPEFAIYRVLLAIFVLSTLGPHLHHLQSCSSAHRHPPLICLLDNRTATVSSIHSRRLCGSYNRRGINTSFAARLVLLFNRETSVECAYISFLLGRFISKPNTVHRLLTLYRPMNRSTAIISSLLPRRLPLTTSITFSQTRSFCTTRQTMTFSTSMMAGPSAAYASSNGSVTPPSRTESPLSNLKAPYDAMADVTAEVSGPENVERLRRLQYDFRSESPVS